MPDEDISATDPGPHGYSGDKRALLGRLRRIEGQIRGLQRMVEEDTYCIDVLTQISAAKSALHAVRGRSARGSPRPLCRGRGAAGRPDAEGERSLRRDRPPGPILIRREHHMAVTSTYTVTGMTCEHCVRAVTEELSGCPASPASRSTSVPGRSP
jgi:hypothetical protein